MNQTFTGQGKNLHRLGVAEAKARFSELLRGSTHGPTIIHSRGRDVAVVMPIEQFETLTASQITSHRGGASFLARIEALKKRLGGGVEGFEPARFGFEPHDPFADAHWR